MTEQMTARQIDDRLVIRLWTDGLCDWRALCRMSEDHARSLTGSMRGGSIGTWMTWEPVSQAPEDQADIEQMEELSEWDLVCQIICWIVD